jgi:putative transposase
VHPTQIAHWKHRLQKEMSAIFSVRRDKGARDQELLQAQLYQQIGQLKVALDGVKKNAGLIP